jgi:hypothetical protein
MVAPGAPTLGRVRLGVVSLCVTVNEAFAGLPVVATGPVAIGAWVVLVIGPAVFEVTVATT